MSGGPGSTTDTGQHTELPDLVGFESEFFVAVKSLCTAEGGERLLFAC